MGMGRCGHRSTGEEMHMEAWVTSCPHFPRLKVKVQAYEDNRCPHKGSHAVPAISKPSVWWCLFHLRRAISQVAPSQGTQPSASPRTCTDRLRLLKGQGHTAQGQVQAGLGGGAQHGLSCGCTQPAATQKVTRRPQPSSPARCGWVAKPPPESG